MGDDDGSPLTIEGAKAEDAHAKVVCREMQGGQGSEEEPDSKTGSVNEAHEETATNEPEQGDRSLLVSFLRGDICNIAGEGEMAVDAAFDSAGRNSAQALRGLEM